MAESAGAPSQPESRGPTPPTILVVDDDALFRSMVRRILTPTYRVVEATDGREALAQIQAAPPDLVLLDVLLPGLHGWGVLRALRTRPALRAIPVVLVSGHVVADDHQVRAWGAVAQLPKPFQASALLALVADLLGPQPPLVE